MYQVTAGDNQLIVCRSHLKRADSEVIKTAVLVNEWDCDTCKSELLIAEAVGVLA